MNFITLKTRVAEMMGNKGINALIGNWLNFAQRDLAHRVDFDQLLTSDTIPSVISQATYALPSDIDRIKNIVWKGDIARVLQPLLISDYDILVPHTLTANDEGDPKYYTLIGGNQYNLHPVPLAVKDQVRRYYKVPVDMVDDLNDSPEIPEKYHHELIWLGYWWGRMYEQDPAASQQAMVEYERVVARIQANETKHKKYSRGLRPAQDLRTTETRWH